MVSAIVQGSSHLEMDPDQILVDRVLRGDSNTFDTLYRRYYEKVYSIARSVLGDADDAADAVQEVFTLVHKNLHRFNRTSKFSTWIFRIAVNGSIQQARKLKFKNRQTELKETSVPVDQNEDLPPHDPKIDIAMSAIGPADRALLAMFYWEELPLNEIADAMSCSPNAAKTRLYRARERFRVAYEGAESDE